MSQKAVVDTEMVAVQTDRQENDDAFLGTESIEARLTSFTLQMLSNSILDVGLEDDLSQMNLTASNSMLKGQPPEKTSFKVDFEYKNYFK